MQVTITYNDSTSFTKEEIVKFAQSVHGKSATVDVTSDSLAPHDLIYFALQQIITYQQLSLFYDDRDQYQSKLRALRQDTIATLIELLDTVIIDNESKVA